MRPHLELLCGCRNRLYPSFELVTVSHLSEAIGHWEVIVTVDVASEKDMTHIAASEEKDINKQYAKIDRENKI